MSTFAASPEQPRHDVTVVLVTHDGQRWLPPVLAALTAQTRPYSRLVVADTGSTDGTPELLARAVDERDVIRLPRQSGFGAAVHAALAAAGDTTRWVWLLHDDSEPAPDALEHLLEAVAADPGIAIAGPKIRGWYRRRVLLEVGVTIDGGGRRETALERGEQDQGQHDVRRETLAVSSAGMLVRRDVWDALGGFDEHLPLMRDDVDLCWRAWLAGHRVAVVPAAVVYHAEAAAQSRREVSIGAGRVHLLDRAGAMRVLLANLSTAAFLLALPRLALGGLARAIGYLLAKLPRHAADELLAIGAVLLQPRAIAAMRRDRRVAHAVSPKSLRRLFPRPGHQLSQARDALAAVAGGRRVEGAAMGRHRVAESGPGSEEAENFERGAGGVLARRVLRSPGWLLGLGLLAFTLLAGRELLHGGRLLGGALLPAPGGAGELWAAYGGAWHADALGSASAAPPYLAGVAAVATLLGGHADLAVTVLLLGSVPAAGLAAYFASAALPTSRILRIWGAAAYALLPVLGGAVAAGRLGSAVAIALLPLLVLAFVRATGLPGRPGTTRAAWAAALGVTVATAFAPLTWLLVLLAAVAVLGGARVLSGRWERGLLARLAAMVGVPVVALLPWSAELLRQPSRLLAEPGPTGADLVGPAPQAWRLLLFDAGGPGAAPGWVGLAVVVAGLVGFAIATRRELAAIAWIVAAGGYCVAIVASRFEVRAAVGGPEVSAWPGVALALAALGVLTAAVVGASGVAARLAAREFGLAQPAAAAVVALAIAGPVVAGAATVARGADGPVQRSDPLLVPAFVAAEAGTADRPRTLVLRQRAGSLSYAVVRGEGPRLGAADVSSPDAARSRLAQLVADLVSGRGDEQVMRLAGFAVRYVLVKAPVAPELARSLDAVPGLERVSAQGGDGLWRAGVPVARLAVLSADDEAARPLPSGEVGAEAVVPPGGGLLALAEPADARWEAELDGRPLAGQVRDGWAQAFELPAEGGKLTLRYADPVRGLWLFSQASLVVAMVILALPGAARRAVDDEDLLPTVPAPGRRRRPDTAPADGPSDPVLSGAPGASR